MHIQGVGSCGSQESFASGWQVIYSVFNLALDKYYMLACYSLINT